MNLGQLIVSLGVDSKGLGAAHQQMDALGKKAQLTATNMTAAFNNAGRSMQYFGWYASMYLTAPITLFGTAAFNAAKDFEWSMTKIIGLVGESKEQVAAWSSEILKLGPALGSTPKKLAEAMYFITSSGFQGAEAMDILKQSSKAAATGLGDVQKIADFTTSAMNAYKMEGLSASRVMDILTAAVREGKLEATGFTNQIGQVIPVASAMGVQLDELAAALASMSLTGTNASEGVVYLRGILNALLDPAKEAEESLRMMGTSGEELRRIISEQGLLPALKKISDLTNKYGQDLVSKVIPNVRAMTGFMSLLGQNYEHNLQIFKEVYTSTGDMDKAFLAVTDTLQYKWNQALATGQTALIQIGMELKDSLVPMLESVSKLIAGLANWFTNLSDPMQKIIAYSAAFLAVLGPLSAGLGFIIRYLLPALRVGILALTGALANPVFLAVVAAIAAISVVLGVHRKAADQAAAAQKKYNDELEKTKQLQDNVQSIKSYIAIIDKLNKAQLESVKTRIENEIALQESFGAEMLAKLGASEFRVVQYKRGSAEEQYAIQYKAHQQQLAELNTYLKQVDNALKHTKKTPGSDPVDDRNMYKEALERHAAYLRKLQYLREKLPVGLVANISSKGIERSINEMQSKFISYTTSKEINIPIKIKPFISNFDFEETDYSKFLFKFGPISPMKEMSAQLADIAYKNSIMGDSMFTAELQMQTYADQIGYVKDKMTELWDQGFRPGSEKMDMYIKRLRSLQDEYRKVGLSMEMGQIAAQAFTSAMQGNIESAQELGNALREAAISAIGAIVAEAVASMIAKAMKSAKNPYVALALGAAAGAATKALFSSVIPKFGKGGEVPSGYPNDTYPALLTSGEQVMTPKQLSDRASRVHITMEGVTKGSNMYWLIKNYERHLENVG